MLLPASNETKRYLTDTFSYARSIGKETNLLVNLFKLAHGYHNNGQEYMCILHQDFCPYSFLFSCWNLRDITIGTKIDTEEIYINIQPDANPWLSGTLIYHDNYWSIHT